MKNAVVHFSCGCWVEVKNNSIYDCIRCSHHKDNVRHIIAITVESLGRSVTITDTQSFDKISIPLIKRFEPKYKSLK